MNLILTITLLKVCHLCIKMRYITLTLGASYHQPHLMGSPYLNQSSSYAGFVCPSQSTSSPSQYPTFSQPTQCGGFLPLDPYLDKGPLYSNDNRPSYFF